MIGCSDLNETTTARNVGDCDRNERHVVASSGDVYPGAGCGRGNAGVDPEHVRSRAIAVRVEVDSGACSATVGYVGRHGRRACGQGWRRAGAHRR